MPDVGVISYSTSAIAFFGLSLLLLTSWRGGLQGGMLVASSLVSMLWGGVLAYGAASQNISLGLTFMAEIAKNGLWLSFLFVLSGRILYAALPRFLAFSVSVFWVSLFCYVIWMSFSEASLPDGKVLIYGGLLLSLAGIVAVEQLYRNTSSGRRNAVKFLFLGLGSMFAYDLYFYVNALLLNKIDMELWNARGMVNALVVPLIVISTKRNPDWSLNIFVSRHVLFYSTSIVGVGVYLLVMAAGGYYIRSQGGTWGGVAQTAFSVIALLLLAILLLSEQIRAKVIVFLNKHFYHNKYDYREEWLRIIQTLSDEYSGKHLTERVICAVGQIVDSKGGALFLRDESGDFATVAVWQMADLHAVEKVASPFSLFLYNKDWIINVKEFDAGYGKYDDLELPAWIRQVSNPWLIIPLRHQDELLGFVVLRESNLHREVNWEDRDLLRAASRQAASYLALHEASERLERAHQFEAFNRLSAYVVHDLKNMVAQLNLVVKNANKHFDNPEFVKDAINTVDNTVSKMNKLLAQLRKGRFESEGQGRVKLNRILQEVAKIRSEEMPKVTLDLPAYPLEVIADQERLSAVVEHLVQNAQEATAETGSVHMRLSVEEGQAVLQIEDTGSGMSEDFIRTRLFRPFDTTKGNAGMGIGVYESREFVRKLGGRIDVKSTVDEGTCFSISIPLVSHEENITETHNVEGAA